jgi:hypothetical protein
MAITKNIRMRQSIRQEKAKPKSAGKGWRGNWRDQIKLDHSKMGKEQGILLIAGEYADRRPESVDRNSGEATLTYHARHVHTFALPGKKGAAAGYRSTTCRRFFDGSACLACDEFDRGNKKIDGGRKPKSRPRSKFSINALEFDLYEQVDATDRDGKVLRYDSDHPEGKHKRGDVIKRWVAVENLKERKQLLSNPDGLADLVDNGEIRLWRKAYLEVGFGHLGCIEEIADKAAELCRCGGNLTKIGFKCAHCAHMLLNVNEDDATEDMLASFDKEQESCPKCGVTDFPDPAYECDDCDQPEPYSWDQVVAYLHKSGEGAQTTIVIDKVVPLDAFVAADGRSIIETDKDGMAIVDAEDNFQFIEEVAPLATNQFNFESIHEPVDNDIIAGWLEIENPYKSGVRRPSSDSDDGEAVDSSSRRSRGKPASGESTGRRFRG